ncbi:hypothetical protein FJT64_004931 [Amphibalanus amphitrite]|uniref:Uncharacterized protein n=1 Tax=Amphibalanus amphitrite TaxID=1232801 RepID=A0A6A4VN55_AMPAM|nr:hypothetical protein FJT64_004931 [Amphibalanus amphitrite]
MGYLHHYVNNFLFCRAIPTIQAGPDPSVERGDDTELVGSEPGPSSQRGGDTELVGSEPGPSSQRGGDTELVGSEPGPSSQRGGDTELVGSEPGPSSQRGGDTELVGSEPGPSSQRGGDTKLVGSEPGSLSWKIASPEQIRGYPKAAARQGKRKSGTSIVARHANSTPEMKRLKCVMESKNAKKPKGKCSAKAARKLVVESKERPGSDSDVTCLVCGMRFDRSAEEWIQCVSSFDLERALARTVRSLTARSVEFVAVGRRLCPRTRTPGTRPDVFSVDTAMFLDDRVHLTHRVYREAGGAFRSGFASELATDY